VWWLEPGTRGNERVLTLWRSASAATNPSIPVGTTASATVTIGNSGTATLCTSFMNSNAVTEPNAFDKDATRLAYLRPPGNQTPDRDPWPFSANIMAFPLVWGPITP
jgi:hypothetical protein